MAEELKSAEKFREALELLQPVMEHYRREQWRPLLDAVLSLGLKCAYLLADAAQGRGISLAAFTLTDIRQLKWSDCM